MSDHIDEFESMFRRAEREPYVFADVPIESIALVTDGTRGDAETRSITTITEAGSLVTAMFA